MTAPDDDPRMALTPNLAVVPSKRIPVGYVALKSKGKVIWLGHLSDPWEDVDCDEIVVSLADYRGIRQAFEDEV